MPSSSNTAAAVEGGGPADELLIRSIYRRPPQFRSHSIDGTQMARTALSGSATKQRSINNNSNSSNCFAVNAAILGTEQQCSVRQRMNAVPTVKICSQKQCFPPECCYTQCSTDALQKCHDDDDAEQAAEAVHLRFLNCFFFFSSSFCPPSFRHFLPPKVLLRLSLLFLFAVGGCPIVPGGVSATARSRRTLVPLGMDKQMFPPQIFDENAPICTAEREPCGFYSFSLDGKAPLKWIKSWCRCSAQHECVYERTDMRMRVYRQTCIAHDDLLPADDAVGAEEAAEINAAQRQQQSVVLVETVVPSTASADRDRHGDNDAAAVGADGDEDHPQRTHRHHHHKHHRSSNRHHHRHGVVAASAATTVNNASRHSRKTHRQRQVIRRLRELD
ncbi:hypothetical protein niasHS_014141 [Heterodera schachtii]|uniref:Uncharacterized protein n=1 Tax=Heterodera schachtii TaxID=97005 RepID=A0ABD2II83_HETSC